MTDKTGAKLGLGARSGTNLGVRAKPIAKSTTTKQEAEGDVKRVTANSASTKKLPFIKVGDPAKARYTEKRRVAYLFGY